MHVDLTSSSLEDQQRTVARALACVGSQAVGYFWSEALGWPLVRDQDRETAIRSPHGGPKITWGELADPDGNEFGVLPR